MSNLTATANYDFMDNNGMHTHQHSAMSDDASHPISYPSLYPTATHPDVSSHYSASVHPTDYTGYEYGATSTVNYTSAFTESKDHLQQSSFDRPYGAYSAFQPLQSTVDTSSINTSVAHTSHLTPTPSPTWTTQESTGHQHFQDPSTSMATDSVAVTADHNAQSYHSPQSQNHTQIHHLLSSPTHSHWVSERKATPASPTDPNFSHLFSKISMQQPSSTGLQYPAASHYHAHHQSPPTPSPSVASSVSSNPTTPSQPSAPVSRRNSSTAALPSKSMSPRKLSYNISMKGESVHPHDTSLSASNGNCAHDNEHTDPFDWNAMM